MLSFLREQGHEDSSAAKGPIAAGRTPAEAVEDSQEQEYLTVAAQDKNVRKTTCLLAVLFGIGLLCLWFMIKKSAPQTATAEIVGTEEVQIEMAIARLTGVGSEMFRGLEKIVKKFYEFSDVQQVEVNELVKNPFAIEMLFSNSKGVADTEGFDIAPAAEDMELLTICRSEQGICCMIDDRMLYEGDSIGGFKVRQISDSFVKLVPLEPKKKSLTGLEWDPKCNEEHLDARSESLEMILKLSE